MLSFILVFFVFYGIVVNRFYKNIRPVLERVSYNFVPLPYRLVEAWILVTSTLFPMQAIIQARKSNWRLDKSLSVLALLLGLILGLTAEVV